MLTAKCISNPYRLQPESPPLNTVSPEQELGLGFEGSFLF